MLVIILVFHVKILGQLKISTFFSSILIFMFGKMVMVLIKHVGGLLLGGICFLLSYPRKGLLLSGYPIWLIHLSGSAWRRRKYRPCSCWQKKHCKPLTSVPQQKREGYCRILTDSVSLVLTSYYSHSQRSQVKKINYKTIP